MVSKSDKRINKVYLSLGSNLGDRKAHLEECVQKIAEEVGDLKKISSIYESSSWGNEKLPNFLNLVLLLECSLEPEALLKKLKELEKSMGRERKGTKSYLSRTIDIDIIYYNDLIYQSKMLSIPHPQLHKRNFVLKPLNEIASGYIHPVLAVSNRKLLKMSDDKLECIKTN